MKRILALSMVILILCSLASCGKKKKGLAMSGSYFDNISDFADTEYQDTTSVEEVSGVTQAYLQGVTYEIVELDEENKVATLDVSVPNFTKVLPQIVTDVMAENEEASYDELLQIVQEELEKALSDESVEHTTATIELPFEEVDGEYKLIHNEEWEQLVFGGLQEMYVEYYRTMIGGLLDEIPE